MVHCCGDVGLSDVICDIGDLEMWKEMLVIALAKEGRPEARPETVPTQRLPLQPRNSNFIRRNSISLAENQIASYFCEINPVRSKVLAATRQIRSLPILVRNSRREFQRCSEYSSK